jgi:putative endonuclease
MKQRMEADKRMKQRMEADKRMKQRMEADKRMKQRMEADKRMNTSQDGRRSLGRLGEEIAAAYLARLGYVIVTRNWRTRTGELDVVARDGEWLVFVEVRARRGAGGSTAPILGRPEESVTRRKQAQLAGLVEAYLFEQPWDGPWRVDVIALELRGDGSVARLNHLRDAVGGRP